ncbi:hypothetical protein AAHE18_03G222000 [Arachis hypogaea]
MLTKRTLICKLFTQKILNNTKECAIPTERSCNTKMVKQERKIKIKINYYSSLLTRNTLICKLFTQKILNNTKECAIPTERSCNTKMVKQERKIKIKINYYSSLLTRNLHKKIRNHSV